MSMREHRIARPIAGGDEFSLLQNGNIHHNLCESALYELAISGSEGKLTDSGALAVETGQHTGRSASDKFLVCDPITRDTVWWDGNNPILPEQFECLLADFLTHTQTLTLHVQDLYAGANPIHRKSVRILTEYAWHALFIRYLLRRPDASELTGFEPQLTIINMPSFKADPERHGCRSQTVIAANLDERLVLIGDSEYAGETKKSVFGTWSHTPVNPTRTFIETCPIGGAIRFEPTTFK